MHGGHRGQDSVSGWEPPPNTTQVLPAHPYDPNLQPRHAAGNLPPGATAPPPGANPAPPAVNNQNPPPEQQKKKKGFWGHVKDVFK
jgi:hypothetical protein